MPSGVHLPWGSGLGSAPDRLQDSGQVTPPIWPFIPMGRITFMGTASIYSFMFIGSCGSDCLLSNPLYRGQEEGLCFLLQSPLPYLVPEEHLKSKVPPPFSSNPPPRFSIPFLVILPSKVTVTTHRGRGEPRHFNFCRKTSGFSPSEVKRIKLGRSQGPERGIRN